MTAATELIRIPLDAAGRMLIPEKLREQWSPGTVLTLESQEGDAVWFTVQIAPTGTQTKAQTKTQQQGEEGPQLVKKGRVTVIRGDFPEGFDWDTFIEEGNDERLRHVMGWSEQ